MLLISQDKVDDLIYKLAKRTLHSGMLRVVGVENGGLNISVPLAKLLGLPHESIYASRYCGSGKRPYPITRGKISSPTGNLIVDDLVDEGGTFRVIDLYLGLAGNKTAALFWNPQSNWEPDFYAAEKPESWLVFPWEVGMFPLDIVTTMKEENCANRK